ncbi:hypothetical protein FVEG_00075 [Fusarium verticillioides 7600]|uniref:Tc toxin complex TcA C-terminal TcB-binding domain-containing protein n=1 Tax=Gibberella moniliformis (strain M3125 / FGSC 7600) TaxID=334819 RepID=W7LKD3_GIBM7|nr:hypothetical protein FVEG_00075 [Fusarium verticillioides 7600]XP_018742073.1 hypothetical protein FVEG_00075 [Fusarium verticillioides 7600]XP_018742074.1 hypothetical protein FVEG_00075 [Fusarium verticillioides 7600]XP_018742075.1 hypothetical protein FVEG_00075 [Fusarium verticillioides 7600]XP_018742076.1 hypothetical protein FVEG_00075 [Fusarium verticillioides 7600]EWG35881.1 hypothetical protein FVEG_00075 [Fusarium verticillioides 7600]EWG35882.1 hypothetical protein FVEG_00075 [F
MISTFLGTTFDVSNPSPLLEHSYRVSLLVSNGGYIRRDSNDRLRTDRISVSLIALSQRSAGSGVFELNFNSERYLPFENAGTISTWKLELSQHVRQFSYESISDVILHLKYTSRQEAPSSEPQLRTLLSASWPLPMVLAKVTGYLLLLIWPVISQMLGHWFNLKLRLGRPAIS